MSDDIGRMRRRVTIESKAYSPDGQGGQTFAWSTFVSGYAELTPKSGMEMSAAGKLQAVTYMKVTMRFRQGVTATMRVKYVTSFATRYFQIHAVLNQEEQWDYMTLMCEEGVGS